MRRSVIVATITVLALLSAGCAIGFAGKRSVSVDLNILGNRLQWTSTVDGTYTPEDAATETPTVR